jgi:Bacterial membrane protein YfhO
VTRTEGRAAAYLVGGVLLATAVFYNRALLSGRIFIARDVLRVYYPLHAYWAQRVLSGSFPEWYPFDGLGQPFAGMVISGAFHPLNLSFLVLPLGAALTLNTLSCFPVAFLGVYGLARRFATEVQPAVLGGLVFAFSGYLVSSTNNPLYLMAAATVPCALWAADRFLDRPGWARASAAGGLSALVLLAGDVQAFALTLCLLAVIVFCRRARWVIAGLLLASALAASMVQLVPSWDVLSQAGAARQTFAETSVWSTHPLRLLDFIFGPIFVRDPNDPVGTAIASDLLDSGQGTLWADSLYLGLPVILLALCGAWVYRRSRVGRTLLACTLLLLALALGKRAALSALAYDVLPFWRAFRYPEKWMAYVSLGVALGAAAGLQAALQRPDVRRWTGILLGAFGTLSLAFGLEEGRLRLLSTSLAKGLSDASLRSEAAAHFSGELTRGATLSGVLTCLVAAAFAFGHHPKILGWVPVACAFLGLFSLNEPLYALSSPDVLHLTSPFPATLQGTRWRVLYLPGSHLVPVDAALSAMDRWVLLAVLALEPVTPALFGLEGANSYLPAASSRLLEVKSDERAWVLERAGLFSVRYLSIAQENEAEVVSSGKHVIANLPGFGYSLVEDAAALPRAYLARPMCVARPADSLASVQARGFNRAGAEAVVECTRAFAPSTGDVGEVLALASEPERVVLRVRATAQAVVVLNDAFYSGWQASVDGASAPILAANHVVRAVAVEAGTHDVIFTYRTPGLRAAALVTLLFLLGGLGMAARATVLRRSLGPTRRPTSRGEV